MNLETDYVTEIGMMFAIIVTLIFIVNCIFQLLIVIGLPLGHLSYGGKYDRQKLPNKLRITSVIAIIIFSFATITYLEFAGLITILNNPNFTLIYCWIIAIYLTLGVLMNAASKSKWEKRIWTPITLLNAISCYIVLLLS
jgi:preprotein translocase subunit SecY